MEKIDLHVHTCCSDGNLNIDELLALAKKEDISTISITDHETIINLKNYQNLEKKYNINIIPGIEIPTDIFKLHILGYGIKDFYYIEDIMTKLKIENEERNKETINILMNSGINITYEKVKKLAKVDIITYRDIVKYLYENGYVKNPRDAYKEYIGKGTKAYVPSRAMTTKEVLNLIEDSGGISVLAHPFTINEDIDLENLMLYMKKEGLSGIEIYPPKITRFQLEKYRYLLKKFDLIETTGTDFHNSKYDKLGVEVETDYLVKINKLLKKKVV